MEKAGPSPERRIIIISVSHNVYDEIQRIKGNRAWTRWALEMALTEHPSDEVIETEIDSLPKKEPKAEMKAKEV